MNCIIARIVLLAGTEYRPIERLIIIAISGAKNKAQPNKIEYIRCLFPIIVVTLLPVVDIVKKLA